MAGHALRGNFESVDYKEERALKSCHTEFHHIIGAAFYKKGTVILVDYRSFFFFRVLKCIIYPSKTHHLLKVDASSVHGKRMMYSPVMAVDI